ncbi:helix-turn-helix transcriptional regulator [Paracoccus sp. M683]|uniref:ArsR/SmtB family transcription factor n=1 Tax=Paracoccus sp. M683 TaxID=2594268 RepID=UPI0011817202|nr:helix-turn-helix transcriptional regulator [Paracoccus sp. M683]TRW96578.1 helix-turn-helix transcriptional regulator [Paracoccus sp. M683]
MTDRTTQFRAFSSEARLTILGWLADPRSRFGGQESADPVETGVCISLIAQAMGVAQPTASRHVDMLRQAGFVSLTRSRGWTYAKRDEAVIADFMTWLAQRVGPQRPGPTAEIRSESPREADGRSPRAGRQVR